MFLPEILVGLLDLALVYVNVKLGLKVYDRYFLLPRLRAERERILAGLWQAVKWDHQKMVKAKQARIRLLARHAAKKIKPSNVVRLRKPVKRNEKKAA